MQRGMILTRKVSFSVDIIHLIHRNVVLIYKKLESDRNKQIRAKGFSSSLQFQRTEANELS